MAKGKDYATYSHATALGSKAKRPQTRGHAGPGTMTVAEGKTPLTAAAKARLGAGKTYKMTSVESERRLNERKRTALREQAAKRKSAVKKAESKKLNPVPAVQRTGIKRRTTSRSK